MTAGPAGWLRQAAPQLILLALVLIGDALIAPSFLHLGLRDGRLFGSLVDVLNRAAPIALVAVGMALVIATRGVDLSVGAVMAIAGAVGAACIAAGVAWPLALALALAAGLACGLWNGLLVSVLDIQPIVATLILMVAGRGAAQLITQGRIVTFVEPHLVALGGASVFGLPAPVVLAAGAAAAVIALARLTSLGLFIEAVGVNPRASRLAGVPARTVLFAVYGLSGLTAAVAGLVAAGDIRGADANNAGLWIELDAILAVVIGGGSLLGGRFSVSRAVLGALILQALKTGILLSGFRPELNLVVMAVVVAVMLALQSPGASRLIARMKGRPA